MKILARWVISAIAIIITSYLLRGIHIVDFQTALIAALVLATINITIKPILFLLTLPITIITFGLFTLILNAIMILLTAAIVPGFTVDNFWWAILFSIVLTVVNYFLYKLLE